MIDELSIPENLISSYEKTIKLKNQLTNINETESNSSKSSSNNVQQQQCLEIPKDDSTQIKLSENQYFENIKELTFDPSRPPPLLHFVQQDQSNLNQHIQQQITLSQQQPQPFLIPENEINQAQHHHQQLLHNIGLIHSQQNQQQCFINQIRSASTSTFPGGQLHHPPPSNIMPHLMPLLTQSQLQSHLKNQQQQPQHNISGLPLQMLASNMIGSHPSGLSNQNRPTFHLSPQVHFLQRPIITQQSNLTKIYII